MSLQPLIRTWRLFRWGRGAQCRLDFYEQDLNAEARKISRKVASRIRFFHWELEFPDVFRLPSLGFDAILGNPPWDIAKPKSQEFFSGIDPLYRSYGKQEAIAKQKAEFEKDRETEERWLSYNAVFRAQSNWVKFAGHPFGDRITTDSKAKDSHDLNLGSGGKASFAMGERRHQRWRQKREVLTGYADAHHPFQMQGGADLNLYKMFLEAMLALRRESGRIGVLLPSSIHNDKGSQVLREKFLPCLEMLITFDNEKQIFVGLEHNLKFDVLLLGNGEQRNDHFQYRFFAWKDATVLESLNGNTVCLPHDFVSLVSPTSHSLPEVRSAFERDLLEAMYKNGSIVGDEFQPISEFHLTNDLKHFSPDGEMPVYQGAMIWHHDHRYNMYSEEKKDWLRGKHETVELRTHYDILPKRWTTRDAYHRKFGDNRNFDGLPAYARYRIAYRVQSNRANQRTFVATIIPPGAATGNSVNTLISPSNARLAECLSYFTSFAFDFNVRTKVSGNINNFYIPQFVFPSQIRTEPIRRELVRSTLRLVCTSAAFSPLYQSTMNEIGEWDGNPLTSRFAALTPHERLRLRCIIDSLILDAFAFTRAQAETILLDFRGVDRQKSVELRQPVLTLIAYNELLRLLESTPTREEAIAVFLSLNNSEGWQLPETLRLADYGLGHDERANEHQPVRACFGPRFYDWQLEQSPEESWQECHLHARNLLGPTGYQALLDELAGRSPPTPQETISQENQMLQRRLFIS